MVFLLVSDQEGVGAGLLEQVQLHLPRSPNSSSQSLRLLRVKLAVSGRGGFRLSKLTEIGIFLRLLFFSPEEDIWLTIALLLFLTLAADG